MKNVKRKLQAAWLRLVRWLFRLFGGFHLTEHEEIKWAALCQAELETAELRLYKHHMQGRFKSLNRMLNEELTQREPT